MSNDVFSDLSSEALAKEEALAASFHLVPQFPRAIVGSNEYPAQSSRPVIISSQNDRITASGKFLGIEACLFEALQEPIRTRFNLGLKLGIGRYGRKPKKFDQIIKRIIPGHVVSGVKGGQSNLDRLYLALDLSGDRSLSAVN